MTETKTITLEPGQGEHFPETYPNENGNYVKDAKGDYWEIIARDGDVLTVVPAPLELAPC